MEDGLRVNNYTYFIIVVAKVLILVLVEDGLREVYMEMKRTMMKQS